LLVAAAADYDRIELALARELRRAPTDAEIGARLEWSPARVKQIREIVVEARRRHDEEILLYLDPEQIDLDPAEPADDDARA
jgi:DNA-directed RNA polymerase sigma subunit (sigma70/sigma32)